LLDHHARIRPSAGAVGQLLHLAYAWESLSLGLVSALSLLLRRRRLSTAAKDLKDALARRPSPPSFEDELAPELAADHSVAFLRESQRVHAVLPSTAAHHIKISRSLVAERDPVLFLTQLVEQHRLAKGGEAWFRLSGDRVAVLSPGKNLDFQPSARRYRLDAYAGFLHDLGKLR
jgi:hypothetical protein